MFPVYMSYKAYKTYMSVTSALGALRDGIVKVGNVVRGTISGGLAGVAKKTQDLSDVIQENVRPSVTKALEELPKTVQKASGAIEEAAGGAKNTIASYWEWVKKRAEGGGK